MTTPGYLQSQFCRLNLDNPVDDFLTSSLEQNHKDRDSESFVKNFAGVLDVEL